MTSQSRTPRGIPTGGQFAAQSHAEVDISLDGDEVVTAGALRDALGRLDYDTPVSEELLGEVMREASVRTSADPPRRYACTACGVEDRNHRFAACDGGEWVEI